MVKVPGFLTQIRIPRLRRAPRLPKRRSKYDELIHRHFLPAEARAFSQAESLGYREFQRMTVERLTLWKQFLRQRPDLDPRTKRFDINWQVYVFRWYKHRDLMTLNNRMKRVISPWDYFDQVSYKLPEEQRYTKKSRRKNQQKFSGKDTAALRALKKKWINEHLAALVRDPRGESWRILQVENLGGKVPAKIRRAAGK